MTFGIPNTLILHIMFQAQEMSMLGPFVAARVPSYLPSKLRCSLDAGDVVDSWERFFAVTLELMRRGGYPNVEVALSQEEKHLIRRSFALLRDNLSELGAATFIAVFREHSKAKMFFPVFKDSPLEDLAMSEVLQDHGLRVMQVYDTFNLFRINILSKGD